MLDAQLDRCQRILHLVRDLSRHLTPRKDTLRPKLIRYVVEGDDHTATRSEAPQSTSTHPDPTVLDLEIRTRFVCATLQIIVEPDGKGITHHSVSG